ncbi:hypothetical protein QU42_28300 [Bradyrhizobium sp. UASWS1016]|mgnify:FL=1|jgi:hypothetical protein|nr:hypothetical protein QU41_31290 [Bradyrhizobium elkanii]OCX27844.1 hypothetical protein QU42_28300 [Bradyrhizobium sp. UASWS1016]
MTQSGYQVGQLGYGVGTQLSALTNCSKRILRIYAPFVTDVEDASLYSLRAKNFKLNLTLVYVS